MTSNWQTILGQIHQVQEAARMLGYPLWYRGHRLADWPLRPTLHRRIDDGLKKVGLVIPEGDKVELLRDTYKGLYQKYKARSWHLLSFREMSDWGIIFSMQHHGVPTRLLDWTESFACALYFAHYDRKPSDAAAIFILSPEELNAANFGTEGQVALGENVSEKANVELSAYHPGYVSGIRPLHTIAVAPVLSNPRMVAQQSTFTLSGDPFQPLEHRYSEHIKKIVLPADTYNESMRFLRLVGIGDFKYFPDFQGLQRQLTAQLDSELEMFQALVNRSVNPELPFDAVAGNTPDHDGPDVA